MLPLVAIPNPVNLGYRYAKVKRNRTPSPFVGSDGYHVNIFELCHRVMASKQCRPMGNFVGLIFDARRPTQVVSAAICTISVVVGALHAICRLVTKKRGGDKKMDVERLFLAVAAKYSHQISGALLNSGPHNASLNGPIAAAFAANESRFAAESSMRTYRVDALEVGNWTPNFINVCHARNGARFGRLVQPILKEI